MMTDQKRVSLISVGSSKEEKRVKTNAVTTRFNLSLTPNSGEEYATFNYESLISKNKVRKEPKVNGVGPLDPFADDDEDQLKDIARNFEAKYGTPEKKKYGCFVNYNELGEGYDENDSFIDNSEAFDEVVPDNQTTEHGGFYVNVGPLEMKTIPGAADGQSDSDGNVGTGMRKGTKRPLESESEEDSDDDDDEDDDDSASTSASDSDESIEEQEATEDLKQSNGEANGQVVKKAKSVQNDSAKESQGPPLKKKKNKTSAIAGNIVKKVADSDVSNVKRDVEDSLTGGESRRPSTNSEVAEGDRQNEDTGSSGSKSNSGSADSSESEDSGDGSETPKQEATALVENLHLPEDIRELIRALHGIVNSNPAAKGKVFSPEVNKTLLRFEMKCQDLPTPLYEEAYNQLSLIMSCSPKKLVKKASEILKSHVESSIAGKIQSLKIAVDQQMPLCLERYNGLCERLVNESNPDEETSKMKKPRRRFRWTPEMRGMVCELMKLRRTLYKLHPTDGLSEDDDVRSFLNINICPLWPAGWMKVVALMDIRPAQNTDSNAVGTSPAAAKPKKMPSVPRKGPKVANVPQSMQSPVIVPPVPLPLSAPAASPVKNEHSTSTIIKKPSPPKVASSTNIPANIGKSFISVPQGTDITPVNLSSSKPSPVNGANRPAQITVKPVLNPNQQYSSSKLREDTNHSVQKQVKAKPQVSSESAAVRTHHIKPSDVLQNHDSLSFTEQDTLLVASDPSAMLVDHFQSTPVINKVGMSSPEKQLSNRKTRPLENPNSSQWKVKDEPTAMHETQAPAEDEVLILEDYCPSTSNHKRPLVIEVTSLRNKSLGGDVSGQNQIVDQGFSERTPSISVNGNQAADEMTITVSPVENHDHQTTPRSEERSQRNPYEEQTSPEYRMNVHNFMSSISDMLDANDQRQTHSVHLPQLEAGGGNASSERLQAPVGGQVQIGDSRLGEPARGDSWDLPSQPQPQPQPQSHPNPPPPKNRETPPRKLNPQAVPRSSSAEASNQSRRDAQHKDRKSVAPRLPPQHDVSITRSLHHSTDSRMGYRSSEGKTHDTWMTFNPEVDLRHIDSRQVDLRLVEPRQNVVRQAEPRQADSRLSQQKKEWKSDQRHPDIRSLDSRPHADQRQVDNARSHVDQRKNEARQLDQRQADKRLADRQMSQRQSDIHIVEHRQTDGRFPEVRQDGRSIDHRQIQVRQSDAKHLESRHVEARQKEARQSEARQMEARQSEARQIEVRQSEARQMEARQMEARQSEARQMEARQSEARQMEARQSEARQMEARQSEARQMEARQSEARQMEARQSEARQMEARQSEARQMEARQSEARQIEARLNEARQMEARQKEVRQSEARQKEPRQAEARHFDARQSDIRMPDIRHAEARQSEGWASESRHAESRHFESRHAEARNEPRQSDQRQFDTRHSEVRQVDSRQFDNRHADHRSSNVRQVEARQTAHRQTEEAHYMDSRFVEQHQVEQRQGSESSHADGRFSDQLTKEDWQSTAASNHESWYGDQHDAEVRDDAPQIDPSSSDPNQGNWQNEAQGADPKRIDPIWIEAYFNSQDLYPLEGDSELGVPL